MKMEIEDTIFEGDFYVTEELIEESIRSLLNENIAKKSPIVDQVLEGRVSKIVKDGNRRIWLIEINDNSEDSMVNGYYELSTRLSSKTPVTVKIVSCRKILSQWWDDLANDLRLQIRILSSSPLLMRLSANEKVTVFVNPVYLRMSASEKINLLSDSNVTKEQLFKKLEIEEFTNRNLSSPDDKQIEVKKVTVGSQPEFDKSKSIIHVPQKSKKPTKAQIEKRDRIQQAREMKKLGMKRKEIALKLKVSIRAVDRYLASSE